MVAELFVNGIQLPGSRGPGALDVVFCMTTGEEEVAARGVGLYALYRLYNCIRYNVFQTQEFQDVFFRDSLEKVYGGAMWCCLCTLSIWGGLELFCSSDWFCRAMGLTCGCSALGGWVVRHGIHLDRQSSVVGHR